MPNRITKKRLTFAHPFSLESHDEVWPAGDYTIETEEEQLETRSTLAYRRIETVMIVPPEPGKRAGTQFVRINPAELEAALSRDRESSETDDMQARAEDEGMKGM